MVSEIEITTADSIGIAKDARNYIVYEQKKYREMTKKTKIKYFTIFANALEEVYERKRDKKLFGLDGLCKAKDLKEVADLINKAGEEIKTYIQRKIDWNNLKLCQNEKAI